VHLRHLQELLLFSRKYPRKYSSFPKQTASSDEVGSQEERSTFIRNIVYCIVLNQARWEDNIMMDLREVGYESMDWIDLAEDRDRWRTFVNAVMNLRVP
jgi:hypothetical protein